MPETAKLKSLDRPAGRLVVVGPAFRKLERIAEDLADAGCVMPGNGQAAASLGTVQGECSDDHMTARTNGLPDASGIGELVGGISQKVKRRAIMPHVINAQRPPCRYVGDDPIRVGRPIAQPGFDDSMGLF
jgi:hypothetical protein